MTDEECAKLIGRWSENLPRAIIISQLSGSRRLAAYVAAMDNPAPFIADVQHIAKELSERPLDQRGRNHSYTRGAYR